jgi:hypothetical protein
MATSQNAGATAIAGLTCSTAVPTPGFDPFTASDEELASENDFPPQPRDPAMAAQWTQYANKYLAGEIRSCVNSGAINWPFPGDSPIKHGTLYCSFSDACWSGYVVHDHSYTDADGSFLANSVSGTTGDYSSHWIGVGEAGTNTHPIWQAGVDVKKVSGGSACVLWTEAYPLATEWLDDVGQYCYPNDSIYIHVTVSSHTGTFHVVDFNTLVDYYDTTTVSTGTIDGHAEMITERVQSSYLANFGTEYFDSTRAYSAATGWKTTDLLSNYTYVADNASGQMLMYPWVNSGGTFYNTWVRRS